MSGMHGSLQDTVEILWKLGCGPLKSYRRGDACAWTGCLQLMMRSKRPKNAHTCVLVLPVEMAVNSLAFLWRIHGDPIPGYEDLEASKE